MSCCHGSNISGGSQEIVVLQIWQKKNEKNNVYDFPVYYCTQEQNGTPYFSSMV